MVFLGVIPCLIPCLSNQQGKGGSLEMTQHQSPQMTNFMETTPIKGTSPPPQKWNWGRGVTPEIPLVVPCSLLWGRLNKWNWGAPTPVPLKAGGRKEPRIYQLKPENRESQEGRCDKCLRPPAASCAGLCQPTPASSVSNVSLPFWVWTVSNANKLFLDVF